MSFYTLSNTSLYRFNLNLFKEKERMVMAVGGEETGREGKVLDTFCVN